MCLAASVHHQVCAVPAHCVSVVWVCAHGHSFILRTTDRQVGLFLPIKAALLGEARSGAAGQQSNDAQQSPKWLHQHRPLPVAEGRADRDAFLPALGIVDLCHFGPSGDCVMSTFSF